MNNQKKSGFTQEFEKTYEQCIYRYRRTTECNMTALEENRLYFSTPANFNDPFDNLIFANLDVITSHFYSNVQFGMPDYLKKLNNRDPLIAKFGYAMWYGPDKDKILENYINIIINAVDSIKKAIRHNVKIICFSEVYDSMLMWSHYAENHKGHLLVYDKNELKNAKRYSSNDIPANQKTVLEKVEYVKNQIDLTDDIEDYVRYNVLENLGDVEVKDGTVPSCKLRKAVTQKSDEWAYEKEWRLIPRIISLENQSELEYIECVPKAVILGAHCSKENSERIIACSKKNKIPVYRMFLDEFSPCFKLNLGEGENAVII